MAQNYEIDIKRFNGQDYDILLPTPASHASTHQANGSDPLTLQEGNYGNSSIPTSAYQNTSVTRAKLAQDALYSPINALRTGSFDYSPVATDLGKTLVTFNNTGEYKINITEAVSSAFPVGAEIAVLFAWGVSAKIVFSGSNAKAMILGNSATAADVTLAIPERYGMAALKLINYQNGVYYWLVTGNVEVVS